MAACCLCQQWFLRYAEKLAVKSSHFHIADSIVIRDYLNEKYDLEFPESEYETLSGYIISEHEKIPKPKERIIIDKYEFDVLNVSDTRIEMIKIKVLR